jgi:hypothetical protein
MPQGKQLERQAAGGLRSNRFSFMLTLMNVEISQRVREQISAPAEFGGCTISINGYYLKA